MKFNAIKYLTSFWGASIILTLFGIGIGGLLNYLSPCVTQNNWFAVSVYYITFLAIVWYSNETRNMRTVMSRQYQHSKDKDTYENDKAELYWQIHEASFPEDSVHGYVVFEMKKFYNSNAQTKYMIYELLREGLVELDMSGKNVTIKRQKMGDTD